MTVFTDNEKVRNAKADAANEKGEWYTPPPVEWLAQDKWAIRSALLLFLGLKPETSYFKWEGPGDIAALEHVERLGSEYNTACDYRFHSRLQLEDEIRSIRKYAANSLNEYQEQFRLFQPTIAPEFALRDFIDRDKLHQCECWLGYYDETEKLLNQFLTIWANTEGLDSKSVNKVEDKSYVLHWVVKNDLIKHIPWWDDAVSTGVIPDDHVNTYRPTSFDNKNRGIRLKTRAAIATYLGLSVSTVKNLLKEKGFPFEKRNGEISCYSKEIDKYVAKRKDKRKKK